MTSIIKPKSPKGKGWRQIEDPDKQVTMGYEGHQWIHEAGFVVISAVEVASDEDPKINIGPEYHISISKAGGQRCTRNEAKFITKAFSMEDADEDNHVPGGFVRNYWMPVNENLRGYECPCKQTEQAFKENKGDFVWRGYEEKAPD